MTPECQEKGLLAVPVKDEIDVEILRVIRNACKDGFSTDNEEITPQQQEAWWTLMSGKVKAWLYVATASTETVGFGLLRQTDDGRWWSSVAVVPEAAGHGYGGAITADVVRRSDETVYATARLDNPAAMRLHREADWEETGRDDRLVHYATKPHVHMKMSLEDWGRHGWQLS